MGTAKSPKSPKSPKTVKHRKPDKITYHPLISLPEVGLPITDADRVKLFRTTDPKKILRVRKNITAAALMQLDPALTVKKNANAEMRRDPILKHRAKIEVDELETAIKEMTEQLDKFKRDKKFHDFQAKKEDKVREHAELLKLWKSENPPYAGEGATAYVADSSDEDDDSSSSPPTSSFFGFFDKFKSPKYKPLRQAGVRPKKLAAHPQMHVYEPANSDKRWKEFRADQIKTDEGNIVRLENDLKDYRERLAKYTRSGGRGRIITVRRRRASITRRRPRRHYRQQKL